MEKRKSRTNSHDSYRSSIDSQAYSIESFSTNDNATDEDEEKMSPLMKPVETKSQNYMETSHRRKRESSYQSESKSPSIEYVLNKIFQHKDAYQHLFENDAVE